MSGTRKAPQKAAKKAAAKPVVKTVAKPTNGKLTTQQLADSEVLLEQSRSAWELGHWDKLSELADLPLETNPNREKLALLASVGLAQRGDMAASRSFAKQAKAWGCDPEILARGLIGSCFNSLARMASLLEDNEHASELFETSIKTVNPRADGKTLGRARDIHEKVALGLLPEAAKLMGTSFDALQDTVSLSPSQVDVFKSQLGIINHTISLAQQRRQLVPEMARDDINTRLTLEQKSVSQLGQDLWVLEQTGHKRDGFFVEFGATDGVLLSNSWLLEKEFGWQGICAEPNPEFFKQLQLNRNCQTVPECVLDKTGKTVDFILADEYGGVVEHAKADKHAKTREAFEAEGAVISVQTISLDDMLKKYNAPRHIDYMSIDTEGSEYEILRDFPFKDWDIQLFTIEHNHSHYREDLQKLLATHGYVYIEQKWDDWFIKQPK